MILLKYPLFPQSQLAIKNFPDMMCKFVFKDTVVDWPGLGLVQVHKAQFRFECFEHCLYIKKK